MDKQEQIAELNNKAYELHAQGKLEEMIPIFKKILEIDSSYAPVYHDLCVVYAQLKNFQEAEEYGKKALELEPKDHRVYSTLGPVYFELGEEEKGIGFLEKALELEPDLIHERFNLGIMFHKRGEYESAVKYLAEVAEVEPDNEDLKNLIDSTKTHSISNEEFERRCTELLANMLF